MNAIHNGSAHDQVLDAMTLLSAVMKGIRRHERLARAVDGYLVTHKLNPDCCPACWELGEARNALREAGRS